MNIQVVAPAEVCDLNSLELVLGLLRVQVCGFKMLPTVFRHPKP